MQRITMSIDDSLAHTFDHMARDRGYGSRSEALRDILREHVEQWRQEESLPEHCVANLSYVYDRRVRALADRLSEMEHENHNLVASSTTLRLDHDDSLVTVLFKGPTAAVRSMVEAISTQRGVRFAKLNLVAVAPDDFHGNAGAHEHHGHEHLTPITR